MVYRQISGSVNIYILILYDFFMCMYIYVYVYILKIYLAPVGVATGDGRSPSCHMRRHRDVVQPSFRYISCPNVFGLFGCLFLKFTSIYRIITWYVSDLRF